jgi:hypothetical protein
LLKLKRLSKQALAIICALAILVCGVPMVAASAEEATITNTLETYNRVVTQSTLLKEGSVSATFSSSYGSPSWQNNAWVNGFTTKDLAFVGCLCCWLF